jgi:hypothetical protein
VKTKKPLPRGMGSQPRRQSKNIRDIRATSATDVAKDKVRRYVDNPIIETVDKFDTDIVTDTFRKAVQTTPEDAVKKTHRKAHGR